MNDSFFLDYYLRYPLMRAQDFCKLVYQTAFPDGDFSGCSHSKLLDELREIKAKSGNLVDNFGNFSHVNLAPYKKAGYPSSILDKMTARCVYYKSKQNEDVTERFKLFMSLVRSRKIDLPIYSTEVYVRSFAENPSPVSHSSAYRLNYNPHYRITLRSHALMLPAIAAIDAALERKLNVIFALDGNSGAGKTYFAQVLKDYYSPSAEIIKCDDFFLPQDMRTPARMAEIGGNIHYERLAEVLAKTAFDKSFTYGRYNCKENRFEDVKYTPARLTIVEGVYAYHPSLRKFYDGAFFLSVSGGMQKTRIYTRSPEDYPTYAQKWLPLENAYLETLPSLPTIDTDGYFESLD